jgi:hypothetical protein
MPQTQTLSFASYATKVAFVSGAIAACPWYKLQRQTLTEELAAHTLLSLIFPEIPMACTKPQQHWEGDYLNRANKEVLAQIQAVLNLHGFEMRHGSKSTTILWGHHAEKMQPPQSARELLDVSYGAWAYWLAEALSAGPEPKHALVPEGQEDHHDTLFNIIMGAAKSAGQYLDIYFTSPDEYFFDVARESLKLNGFQYEVIERDNKERGVRIQIRETDPNLPVP